MTKLARLAIFVMVPLVAVVAYVHAAWAAPQSHILRIDPRAGVAGGRPLITTVAEAVQFNTLSQVLQPCAGMRGTGPTLSCWSEQIEKPGSLFTPLKPDIWNYARFLVKVNNEDSLTTLVDKEQWGPAAQKGEADVGTAWLVTLDASSGMGARYGEARKVARAFIEAMQPADLMDLMIFDDQQVIKDSKWKTFKTRNDLVAVLNAQTGTAPSHGRDRGLFRQIEQMTSDGFGSLGNWDQPSAIPLHQAMVVLSNGAGRGDPESSSPSADVFHQYMDTGRFPQDNTALPKTPLPVVSIWFPNGTGLINDIYRDNDSQFMQALANTEIGGFFDVIQEGQGDAKAPTIIKLVKARFDNMWIIHWKMSCLNPTVTQTFSLYFENTTPPIAGDASFKDVPIGIDPTQWPLDVDFDKTTKEAQVNPLYPGGTFTVYGDFCWAGSKDQAEAYFIPAGTQPDPNLAKSRDPQTAMKAQQSLKAQNMVGSCTSAAETNATFQVPDDDKVLEGTGDNTVARVILYDNKAHRASAVDIKTVLSLKAQKKPLNLLLILGIVGGVVVILLLVVVLMRGGGGGRKRGPAAPVAPYGAPPMPGAPPYGPPPGGGYGMSAGAPEPALAYAGAPMGGSGPRPQPMFSPGVAMPPVDATPPPAAVVQVRCPACGMMTMATPGQQSVCFSCGQPLPANITGGGGGVAAPAFPLTGPVPQQPQPPPNPYGGPSPFQPSPGAGGAKIVGALGQFVIPAGAELRVGRDPAQCPIFLSEPRVSGVHATLKFEAGSLFVRDETSNNGTWVSNLRIAPGMWVPVKPGAQVRFGPLEFNVQVGG